MSSSSGSSSSSSSGSGVRWPASQPAIAEGGTPADNGQQRRRQRQRQRRIRIEDDPMVSPVKRGLQRVDTKAEFNTVLDVDGEEEEEDGEEEEAIGLQLGEQQPNPPPPPAATQEPTAAVAGAAAQQEEQQQQQPPPEGAVAPPASLPVSSDPGPGSKPLAPLPPQLPPPGVQPRAILKKTSSYALPPQMNGNGSSGATSGSQPPPIPMPKKTQRTLSFADELGRDLHSVHMAHNTQYSMQGYRRREPVECCTVS